MKKLISFIIILVFLLLSAPAAAAVSLEVDDTPADAGVTLINSVSYVPLRAAATLLCSDAEVSWENRRAVVRASGLFITARPGSIYLEANGRVLYIADGVKLINGTTMVPIRVLAKAMGAEVSWNGYTKSVLVCSGSGTIKSGDAYYSSESVYWLSRIISAESCSEPLKGKIAVGNVVLNRVACSGFPDSIYAVIFDRLGGMQFEPTANGTIYNTPTEESVLAAKLCLEGASVAGESLFFLNPAMASSFWITNNRSYITTIGNHVFYA